MNCPYSKFNGNLYHTSATPIIEYPDPVPPFLSYALPTDLTSFVGSGFDW
jgi:hypothetical protein